MIIKTKKKDDMSLMELYEKNLDHVDQASKDLRAAADHIDHYGHCKNRYTTESDWRGPCCAIGSLQAVKADHLTYGVLYRFLGTSSVSTWNDAEERTKEEVTTALRQAADWVEEVFNK